MWIFSLVSDVISILISSPWILWVLYLAVMWIKRHHPTNAYKWYEYIWVVPVVVVAYLFDIFVNYFVASVWFGELPKSWKEEKTVTDRLNRYYIGDVAWKKLVAQLIGKYLLDRWDPRGKHIGYVKPEEK